MVAVAANRKGKNPPNTRLAVGGYIADILVDCSRSSAVYHWIVQRVGSAEILQWGQETTFTEARAAASGYLRELTRRDRKRAGT